MNIGIVVGLLMGDVHSQSRTSDRINSPQWHIVIYPKHIIVKEESSFNL